MRKYGDTGVADDPVAVARQLELRDRHDDVTRGLIGAWRWPGMYDNADVLREIAEQPYTIDLGGLAGPVGYRTIVVDYGLPERKALWDMPGLVDGIFCLHTLEHVEDTDLFLACCAMKMKPGAPLVVMVPSNRNLNLHHRMWPHHRQTFHLGDEEAAPETRCLEQTLGLSFSVVHEIGYTGNGNLMALASNPPKTEGAD